MNNIKGNKGKSMIIIVLAIIIILSAIVLTLKMTGIIKPAPKTYNRNNISTSQEDEVTEGKSKYDIDNEIKDDSISKISKNHNIIIIVGFFVGFLVINIGICKLYNKLGMPKYILIFNLLWPILAIPINIFLVPVIVGVFINPSLLILIMFLLLVFIILEVISLRYYFKGVGMSGNWGFLPIVSILSSQVGNLVAIIDGGILSGLISLVGTTTFFIAYVISNIKLGQLFNKGSGFTLGLVLLPFIFQPILGYKKDTLQ